MNSLSSSRFHYEFTVCFENSAWIHFFRQITMNSLSASQFSFDFAIFFATSLWIHYLNPEITMNSRFFRDFTMISLFFVKSLWIHSFFREFTICFATWLCRHYLLHDFAIDSLSFPLTNLEFTIYFAITLNSLLISEIHCEYTICFANFLWIHNLLRDFTMNSLSFPRNHCEFTIYFENLFLIHYLFRDIS